MNLKTAKMIRRALRAEGTPAGGAAYASPLPYLSAPVVWNDALKMFVKGTTLKPLRLHPGCGRFKYQYVKKALVGKVPTV